MREKKDQMSKITIRVASHHACITLTQENSCEGLNLSGFYFSICTLGMPPHRTVEVLNEKIMYSLLSGVLNIMQRLAGKDGDAEHTLFRGEGTSARLQGKDVISECLICTRGRGPSFHVSHHQGPVLHIRGNSPLYHHRLHPSSGWAQNKLEHLSQKTRILGRGRNGGYSFLNIPGSQVLH